MSSSEEGKPGEVRIPVFMIVIRGKMVDDLCAPHIPRLLTVGVGGHGRRTCVGVGDVNGRDMSGRRGLVFRMWPVFVFSASWFWIFSEGGVGIGVYRES